MADLAYLRSMVDVAADMLSSDREQAEKARDYYDGYQWTAAEQAVLRKRKQPIITDNRIRRKVDAIVGIEQRGRVDPRALPRNPDDEQAADIATKALVFVDDVTRLDTYRSAFAYNLAIEGLGGVEVTVKERQGQLDPDVIKLRYEEIFYDPYSREADFSDAGYMGVQKWMTLDKAVEFARAYSDMGEEELTSMLEVSMQDGSGNYEDRPENNQAQPWGDRKKKRVKLAYFYHEKDGEWRLALVCGAGVIYDEPSPYLDEAGKPCCGIILQSCYVDRENRRSGIVGDMISQQDEINKRRSRLLHMLSVRQTMGRKGAVDVAKVKRELASPDGHVEYDQDPLNSTRDFEIIPQVDQIQGQFALLEHTTNAIDNLGPNASLLGQLDGQQSGRAIMAQQNAGMAELAPFYDGIRDWNLRVYRAIWNRIKQFWTEPRWIRVTDQPDKLQFLGINMPQVNQMGQVEVANQVGQLDVDIIIDMAPDYAVLQQEDFERLTDLVKTGMLQLPPDVLIRASSLRNKQELLEALQGGNNPEQAAQQAAMQQQVMQLQFAEKEAEIADERASAEQRMADAAKKRAETAKIGADAQIDRSRLALDVQSSRAKMMLDSRAQALAERTPAAEG